MARVDFLHDQRRKDGVRQFLVRWRGHEAADDSWVAENDILDPSLITAFEQAGCRLRGFRRGGAPVDIALKRFLAIHGTASVYTNLPRGGWTFRAATIRADLFEAIVSLPKLTGSSCVTFSGEPPAPSHHHTITACAIRGTPP